MATRIREKINVGPARKINTTVFFLMVTVLLGLAVLIIWTIASGSKVAGADVPQRGMNAYAARLTGQAEHYFWLAGAPQRGMDAYAARLTGEAQQYFAMAEARQRGMDAYTARLTEQAEHHLVQMADARQRGWDACAARYQAMADYYLEQNR